MAPLSALFSKLKPRPMLRHRLLIETREEDGKEACRKYFTFFKQGECCYCKFASSYLHFSSENSTAVQSCRRLYHDTITDCLNIYRLRTYTVIPGSGRHVCLRQPSSLLFAAFNAIYNAAMFLLRVTPLVTFNAHTPQRRILLVVSS